MKDTCIIGLLLALAWFGWRLADVKRQRYTLIFGLCASIEEGPQIFSCLENIQPRTSSLWNLYYGLKG